MVKLVLLAIVFSTGSFAQDIVVEGLDLKKVDYHVPASFVLKVNTSMDSAVLGASSRQYLDTLSIYNYIVSYESTTNWNLDKVVRDRLDSRSSDNKVIQSDFFMVDEIRCYIEEIKSVSSHHSGLMIIPIGSNTYLYVHRNMAVDENQSWDNLRQSWKDFYKSVKFI